MQAPDVSAAPIREPLLRGHQSVAAQWFPSDWFDEPARVARLVASWRPGATALRFAQGDLLCFAAPVEENCENLSGWPLRLESGALCSATLNQLERAVGRDGDVWIVRGAEVLTLHKRDAKTLDPSEWIAVGDLTLHDTYDCRTAIPPPEILDLAARPLRDVLDHAVGPESPETASLLAALRRANEQTPGRARHTPGSLSSPSPLSRIARIFFLLVAVIGVLLLVALLSSGSGSVPFVLVLIIAMVIRVLLEAGNSGGGAGTRTTPVARPTALIPARSKLAHPQRWRRWLAKITMVTQLSRLLGRAHAKHMRRLLDLFDDGDLAEALRNAIPLDGDRGSLGESFGMPGRRGNLELSRTYGPSMSVSLGPELHEHLRSVYRRAFEKLDREGRHDEAVFVLAELLNAKKEALDYLEKHGQFNKAAELALGWDMPPDVIVRFQVLAGDWRRAIAVARRDNAFAQAVVQLEPRWPDAARRLREEWAKALIEQGRWLNAVDAVWPIESMRGQAMQWLLTAEAAGGGLGARALVQRAVLLPDTLERYAQHLQDVQSDPARWNDRFAMAEALVAVGRTPVTQNLAALIAPGVLADHARGQRRFDQKALQQLVDSTGDVLLQADLPNGHWRAVQPVPVVTRQQVLCLEAPAAGTHMIFDVAPLDDQRHLVALGESGACVVDAGGRIIARFATPAHQIVMAYSRQVALLLGHREGGWRVSRLDLVRKAVVDLGLIEFDFCATQFDGINWTVARGRGLRVLDTRDSLRQVVWQVPDLPGNVCALTTSNTVEQIVVARAERVFEFWSYRLPQRLLRSRDDLTLLEGRMLFINPAGGVLSLQLADAEEGRVLLRWRFGSRDLEFKLPPASRGLLTFWVMDNWLVVRAGTNAGWEIRWISLSSGIEHVYALWPEDAQPRLREFGDRWLITDDVGRLQDIDLSTGVVQSLSVR